MRQIEPFPTVKALAKECKARWKGYDAAAEATLRAERKLLRALLANEENKRLLDYDSGLVLFGSFARYEMTDGSVVMFNSGILDGEGCGMPGATWVSARSNSTTSRPDSASDAEAGATAGV